MERPPTKKSHKRADQPLFLLYANGSPEQWIKIAKLAFGSERSDGWLESIKTDTSRIPEAHSNLRALLERIIREQRITDSEELRYFIRVANEVRLMYRVDDGRLVRSQTSGDHLPLYQPWLQHVSFTVAEFLAREPLPAIKRCVCGDYFVDPVRVYCSKTCFEKARRKSKANSEFWRRRKLFINRVMEYGRQEGIRSHPREINPEVFRRIREGRTKKEQRLRRNAERFCPVLAIP